MRGTVKSGQDWGRLGANAVNWLRPGDRPPHRLVDRIPTTSGMRAPDLGLRRGRGLAPPRVLTGGVFHRALTQKAMTVTCPARGLAVDGKGRIREPRSSRAAMVLSVPTTP